MLFATCVCTHAQQAAIQAQDEVDRRTRLQKEPTIFSDIEEKKVKIPEIAPGEMEDTGPQFIIQRKIRRKLFEAAIDSQYYYTSNMFLQEEPTGGEPVDTGFLVNTAQFAYAPDPYDVWDGKLFPRIGFRHQWYNYAVIDDTRPSANNISLNNFDFQSQTVFMKTRYRVWENWVFSGGFDWQRLISEERSSANLGEFYKEYVPNWGVERIFPIDDDSNVSAAYDGNFRFTETKGAQTDHDTNDRTDQSVTLSYIRQVLPNTFVQVFGRYQYSLYTRQKSTVTNEERQDHLYSTGIYLSYIFNDYVNIRTFFVYDHRESEDPIQADYDKYDGGGGLSVNYRF